MRKLVILLILSFPLCVVAQKKVVHTNYLWFGYANSVAVNNKVSILNDVLFRTKDWANQLYQVGIRTGVSYSLNKKLTLAAGVTWFGHGQYTEGDLLIRNEWRPWADGTYLIKFKKADFFQRLRLEDRFLQLVKNGEKTHEYENIWRLRYRAEFVVPFKNKKWGFRGGNEVMVYPGYIGNSRFFDQDRLYGAILYNTTSSTQIQVHLMKIFQWRSSVNTLEDQSVLRLHIIQQLHLNKKHVQS